MRLALLTLTLAVVLVAPVTAEPDVEALRAELAELQGADKLAAVGALLRLYREGEAVDVSELVYTATELLEQYPLAKIGESFLIDLSWALSRSGDAVQGLVIAQRAKEVATKSGSATLQGLANYHVSLAFWYQSRHDAALEAGAKSLQAFQGVNNLTQLAKVHTLLGAIHRSKTDLASALTHHTTALGYAQQTNDAASIARSHNNIGLLHWTLNNLELANDNLTLALGHYEHLGNTADYGSVLSNLGLIHIEAERPKVALDYLERALALHERLDQPRTHARVLSNLAYAHEALGDDAAALGYQQSATEMRLAINDHWGLSRSLGSLGGLFYRQGDLTAAETHYEEALEYARRANARSEQSSIQGGLARLYADQSQFDKAYAALNEKIRLTEEINAQKSREQLARLQSDREIARKDVELARQSTQRVVLGAVAAVLLFTVIGLFLFARGRSSLLKKVNASNQELEAALVRLSESEQRYRGVFDDAVVPKLVIHGETGQILDANEPAGVLCGASVFTLRNQTIGDIQPQWLADAISSFQSARSGAIRLEAEWQRSADRKGHAQIWMTPISSNGQLCVLVTVHDDSEMHRLEEDQIKLDKLESLGVLAGGLAHDFNNALSAILGHISLARDGVDERSDRELAMAEEAVQHSAQLTRNLLAFAKGGGLQPEIQDVGELLTDATRFALSGSEVQLHLDIAEGLWAAEVDAGQFRQLISNLVMNGAQAMAGKGDLSVRASNHKAEQPISPQVAAGDFVRIEVTDVGPGIDRSIQSQVFDPYFTTKETGSGLGLTSAFAIASRHSGWLDFTSEQGRGTTFVVHIPARETAPARKQQGSVSNPRGSERVLVMDDDVAMRRVYQSALESLGYTAVITSEGGEAIACYEAALASERPFDLVVLDLTVPGGMGGKEVMRQLIALDPNAVGVVASGYSNDVVMSSFRDYGFRAALTKPFGLNGLGTALRSVLDETPDAG